MDTFAAGTTNALLKKTLDVKFDLSGSDYEAVENIGSGAYGVVCSAFKCTSKEQVAVKKIPHIFEQEIIAKRTYREIKILKHFKHDNIIAIRDILRPKSDLDTDVYIVLDLMESDLHRIIHSKQDLSNEHTQYFMYQLLCGLQYVHSARVVHRDLKPSNLLVNANCDLKIGDFGMARGIGFVDSIDYKLTQYVATRWYRAPELISSKVPYTASVDMWSVGCIFGELLARRIIFPGRNPLEQLNVIMDSLGAPPAHVCRQYHDIHRRVIAAHGPKVKKSLSERLSDAPSVAMELLQAMLEYDPKKRIDAYQSLRHPFLAKYHSPDSVYEKPCIPQFDFIFETQNLSRDELRDAIMKEIMDFHKPKRVSKIPFNFKPVSQGELQKSQEQKAAVIRAKQQARAAVERTNDVDKTQEEPLDPLQAFLRQKQQEKAQATQQDSTQAPDRKPMDNHPLATVFPGITDARKSQSQVSSVDNFKEPQDIPKTNQSHLLVKTEATACQHDVEMPSADRGTISQRLKPEESDIEMLSAKAETKHETTKSENGFHVDFSHTNVIDLRGGEDLKEAEQHTEDDKINTKERLKAAILKAALRKQNTDTRELPPKPVTAVQKRKEKEERKRRKLAKAKQKQKLNEKESSPLLTQDDKALLARWAQMQTPRDQEPEVRSQQATRRAPMRQPLSPRHSNIQLRAATESQAKSVGSRLQATVVEASVSVSNTLLQGSSLGGSMISVASGVSYQTQASVGVGGTIGAIPSAQSSCENTPMSNVTRLQQPAVPPGFVIVGRTNQIGPVAGLQVQVVPSVGGATMPASVLVTKPSIQPVTLISQATFTTYTHTANQTIGVQQNSKSMSTQRDMNICQPPVINRSQTTATHQAIFAPPSVTSQSSVTLTHPSQPINAQSVTLPPSQSQRGFPEIFIPGNNVDNLQANSSLPTEPFLNPMPSETSQIISPSELLRLPLYEYDYDELLNVLPTPDFSTKLNSSDYAAQASSFSEKLPQGLPPCSGAEGGVAAGSVRQGETVVSHETSRSSEDGEDSSGVLSIITKLQRSHMNEPLMLTVTPKTQGEPYGVGPDLLPELFLQDDRQSGGVSAMSAASATESMIGDWLDMIGMEGVTNKDYETLERDLQALEQKQQQESS